jgi:hypothetical protein
MPGVEAAPLLIIRERRPWMHGSILGIKSRDGMTQPKAQPISRRRQIARIEKLGVRRASQIIAVLESRGPVADRKDRPNDDRRACDDNGGQSSGARQDDPRVRGAKVRALL